MFFEKEYNAGKQPSKPYEWMEPMKQEFYNIMGWDERGRPTDEKLTELGLHTFQVNNGQEVIERFVKN